MSNNRAHLSPRCPCQRGGAKGGPTFSANAPPSQPPRATPFSDVLHLFFARARPRGPSGPSIQVLTHFPSLSRVISRAVARTHTGARAVHERPRTPLHLHVQREGKRSSAPCRLCLTRGAVENQYRETRKQRQGVDSNLRAGSIPVPPLLPPSPVLHLGTPSLFLLLLLLLLLLRPSAP